MQTYWSGQLNPVLKNTIVNGIQLSNIILAAGDNVINTKLQRKYQGYFLTGMRTAFSQVFEVPTGDTSLTLTLNSSVPTVVDIWIY